MFPFEKSRRARCQNETAGEAASAPRPRAPGMLRAMGKLAERYRDAARSGMYCVRDAGIPRAAAVEAGALLIELAAARLAEGWARLEEQIGAERTRPCVVIVADAAALARPEHRPLLQALAGAADACRGSGRPLFAVMVDPDARLGLPRLYRERAAQ